MIVARFESQVEGRAGRGGACCVVVERGGCFGGCFGGLFGRLPHRGVGGGSCLRSSG